MTLAKSGTSVVIRSPTSTAQAEVTGDRLKVDAVVGTPVPATQVMYEVAYCLSGGSKSFAVNGSSTPVNFDYTRTGVTYVESLALLLVDAGTTSRSNFGAITALTNGIELRVRSGGTEYLVATVKDNQELLQAFPQHGTIPPTSGFFEMADAYRGSLAFVQPIRLDSALGDYVRLRVRDNLSTLDYGCLQVTGWYTI